ncbi:MAG: midcut-by-XrtH protein [bacterium]
MKFLRACGLSLFSLFVSGTVYAGPPTITVVPINQSIPTLSATMLVVLSLLLFVIAFRMGINKKHTGTPMVLISAIGIAGIITAGGGIKMVSDVYADGTGTGETLIPIDPFNTPDDTKPLSSGFLNVVENRSNRDQRIENINYGTQCLETSNGPIQGTPECRVGAIIPTDIQGLCYVDCRFNEE